MSTNVHPREKAGEAVDLTTVEAAGTSTTLFRRVLLSPSLALFVLIAAFVLYGVTQSSSFASEQTWINIFRDAAFTGIVAAFSAMVMIAGGLDLSVGSVYVAAAMACAEFMTMGIAWPAACLLALLLGAAIGWLNGMVVNYLRISPIIATLATLFAVRSVVTALSAGETISVPTSFAQLGQGSLLGIPYVIYYALVVCGIGHILLSTTTFGWSARATGGNLRGAANLGISVRRISVAVYILCATAAAFAGILQSARLGSAPANLGDGLELEAIAAAVIGGTSLSGAVGSIPGAALGAVMISVLNYGLVLLHIDPNWQKFVIGLVLLAAAGLDQLRRRQLFKASVKRGPRAGATHMNGLAIATGYPQTRRSRLLEYVRSQR